jgi:adenylylsulfate kinase-like enzyme
MSFSTCSDLDGDRQQMCFDSITYAKKYKKDIIFRFADTSKYPSEVNPISVFMAGSPGAGKTEFSNRLVLELKDKGLIENKPVIIDPDEIRKIFPGYTGDNAYIFQAASAIGVEKLYDHVLAKKQSAIIDGTFSSEKSIQNIARSVHDNRPVEIFYIYQDPKVAWEFTKKREALEKRNIPKISFIEAFFASKDNVNKAKKIFGDKIKLNLVKKDFVKGLEEFKLNIDNVDHYLNIVYTRDDLEKLII